MAGGLEAADLQLNYAYNVGDMVNASNGHYSFSRATVSELTFTKVNGEYVPAYFVVTRSFRMLFKETEPTPYTGR